MVSLVEVLPVSTVTEELMTARPVRLVRVQVVVDPEVADVIVGV